MVSFPRKSTQNGQAMAPKNTDADIRHLALSIVEINDARPSNGEPDYFLQFLWNAFAILDARQLISSHEPSEYRELPVATRIATRARLLALAHRIDTYSAAVSAMANVIRISNVEIVAIGVYAELTDLMWKDILHSLRSESIDLYGEHDDSLRSLPVTAKRATPVATWMGVVPAQDEIDTMAELIHTEAKTDIPSGAHRLTPKHTQEILLRSQSIDQIARATASRREVSLPWDTLVTGYEFVASSPDSVDRCLPLAFLETVNIVGMAPGNCAPPRPRTGTFTSWLVWLDFKDEVSARHNDKAIGFGPSELVRLALSKLGHDPNVYQQHLRKSLSRDRHRRGAVQSEVMKQLRSTLRHAISTFRALPAALLLIEGASDSFPHMPPSIESTILEGQCRIYGGPLAALQQLVEQHIVVGIRHKAKREGLRMSLSDDLKQTLPTGSVWCVVIRKTLTGSAVVPFPL